MDLWQGVLLGLVQGLTEFLPVSSSGHLVLAEYFLGIETSSGVAFAVFVHFATLLAVLTAFRSRVWFVIQGTLKGLRTVTAGRWPGTEMGFMWGVWIVCGSIPAAIVGLALEEQIEQIFATPRLAAAMLLVTGAILWGSGRVKTGDGELSWGAALIIGTGQTFAVLPGISRSGTTIAVGLYLGIERLKAADFSFLLAVPVIAGSTMLMTVKLLASPPDGQEMAAIGAGMVVSYLVGVAAIGFVMKMVQRGRLSWFSYYCWAVGIIALVLI